MNNQPLLVNLQPWQVNNNSNYCLFSELMININLHASQIRGSVGQSLKNMRKIPELSFHIDDSLDYAQKIDELLKE